MPSPKKIKIIPIKIPGNSGFAKITNKKAPIKSGILRTFLSHSLLFSSITSSLSDSLLNLIMEGAPLHPSHRQEINEGSHHAVSNIIF